jgi:pimeloyl-ACP methyl ester carboxylesterase
MATLITSFKHTLSRHGSDKPQTRAHQEVPIFRTVETRAQLMAIYDQKLAQWPVPRETFYVATRYGRTHVIASGDPAAPPLVLLHPAAGGGVVWSSIIATLSAQHRTYALDTIGDVGRSELDDLDRYPKSGRDYSAWLDDVYRELGITQADIVAGSMGGWIAMHHAIVVPHQVRRLVLLGPMGLPSWRASLACLGPMLWQKLRPSEAGQERIIDRSLGPGERVNREYRPWMRLLAKCRMRIGWPFSIPGGTLRKITAPTLVILGGKDGLVGSATAAAQRAHRHIAGCQIEILPNAGHIMSIDEPEVVGKRIVHFLAAGAR